MQLYRKLDVRNQVEFLDIQHKMPMLKPFNITPEEGVSNLYALTEEGTLLKNIDALLAIWRVLPVFSYLARGFNLPGLRGLLALYYGIYLKIRK